jgi:hypothetical protein
MEDHQGIRSPLASRSQVRAPPRESSLALPREAMDPGFPKQVRAGEKTALEQIRDLSASPRPETRSPLPLELDFDEEPEAPDYVVDRLLERQTVTILSGDTGAGKSILAQSLTVAICSGRESWLGRELFGERVLVIDEENGGRVVRSRLRALGMTNKHRERLRYFNRAGFCIGEPEWTAILLKEAGKHAADLIIIDTAMAATSADVNDNDAVARLFGDALRPLASELNAAVLVLHHERKQQVNQPTDPGQAMMGARQWAGQADTHLSLRRKEELSEQPLEGDKRALRSEFLICAPKVRDGEVHPKRIVVVSSEKQGNRLLSMSVEDGGIHEREPSKHQTTMGRIAELLNEKGEMKRGGILTALSDIADTTIDRAISEAVVEGLIVKVKHGLYRAAIPEPSI